MRSISCLGLLGALACGSSTTGSTVASPPREPSPPTAPTTRSGCDGATLPRPPGPDVDLAARVGVRTVVAGELTFEVWYPAHPSTPQPTRYDLRAAMPPDAAAAIPDQAEPWLTCPCTRDAALDEGGPYPIVVFLHGAASFRAQSASLAAAWAARGFVVIAPDLPGVGLRAALGDGGSLPFLAPAATLDLALAAPADGDDPLAFVRPRLAGRAAVVGHSLGAMLANSLTDRPEVAVTIGLAPGLVVDDGHPRLLVAGDRDAIVPLERLRATQASAAGVGLAIVPGADHLSFSDLCQAGARHGGPLAAAQAFGVPVPPGLAALVGDACTDDDRTGPAIAALTSAALDQHLACAADSLASVAAEVGATYLPATP